MDKVIAFCKSKSIEPIRFNVDDSKERAKIHKYCENNKMISRTLYEGIIHWRKCEWCQKWNEDVETTSTFEGVFNGWDRPGDGYFYCQYCDETNGYTLEDMDDIHCAVQEGSVKLKYVSTGEMMIMKRSNIIAYKHLGYWNESWKKHYKK
jgi:hypothetical protein